MIALTASAGLASAQSITSSISTRDAAKATIGVATALLPIMETGGRIDAGVLRKVMIEAFQADDAASAWHWKTAYDACEIASVLFIRKYGGALKRKVPPASALLPRCIRLLASC